MRLGGGVGLVVLASLVLGPLPAGAHSLLVEPPPRVQAVDTTGPCGAGPTVGAPVRQYAVGEMVQVTFDELQTHGTFRIALSSDNASFGTVLLDNIPAQSNGVTRMVTVQMPGAPCDPCVLQLLQRKTGGAYYSCADVRIVAPQATTTTTSTPAGSSSTTTTTTLANGSCGDLVGFDAAACRIGAALSDPPCTGDVVDPTLDRALRAGLAKVGTLLEVARLKTKPAQLGRLLKKADRKLASVLKRSARSTALGRTSEACAASVDALVAELRAAIATLRPA